MGNTGVTKDQVAKAIDQILTRGEEPTINLIRELLGKGSLSTISKHLKKWREENQSNANETTTDNVDDLDALHSVDMKILSYFLLTEHPQTIALTISYLAPQKTATVLENLPDDLRNDVLDRLANISYVNPKFLRILNRALKTELSVIANNEGNFKGGVDYVINVVNMMDDAAKEKFLNDIKSNNPELAKEIQKKQGGK